MEIIVDRHNVNRAMKKIESSSFRKWLRKLRDETGRARIIARVNRLPEGLPGDVKSVGQGTEAIMDRHNITKNEPRLASGYKRYRSWTGTHNLT